MDLNIREFPEALNKILKLEAVRRGVSLRELVIEKCTGRVVRPPQGEIRMKPGSAHWIEPEGHRDGADCDEPPASRKAVGSVSGPNVVMASACEHGRMGICLECKGL